MIVQCVVVSRWWGGQNLGQIRFKHILHATRVIVQDLMSTSEGEQYLVDADPARRQGSSDGESANSPSSRRQHFARHRWNGTARGEQQPGGIGGAAEVPTVRPEGVSDTVWKKLLASCRGERVSRKRRQRTARSSLGYVGPHISDDELTIEELDDDIVDALQKLPAKTQLKAVRQMQREHERRSHELFIRSVVSHIVLHMCTEQSTVQS